MPPTDTKEPIQEGHDQSDLSSLPEKERKETEEILGDIENGGKQSDTTVDNKKDADNDATATDQPTPEELEAAKQKEIDAEKLKSEETVKLADEKKKQEERRPSTLVPAYVLKVQEDQANKKIADLTAQLEEARKAGEKALDAGVKPEDAAATLDQRLQAISEKSGIAVDVLKEVVDLVKPSGTIELPEDLKKDLQAAKDLRAEREVEVEAAKFSADFDRLILPIIHAEYGKDVPEATVTQIKESLKAKAYTQAYAAVPYGTIYKGEDEFRNLVNAKAKGGEGSRGGTMTMADTAAAERGTGVDWKALEDSDSMELSEAEVRKLSDEDFDKYGEVMTGRETRIRERGNGKR